MKYNCLKKEYYHLENYAVTTLREEDILLIKDWRNEQIKVLRQKKMLTDEDQTNYYTNVVKKSFAIEKTEIILFSFLLDKKCIGYGGLTNIDWEFKRAEISFLLETKRVYDDDQYSRDFNAFLNLMKLIAFTELGFNRLFTETFDIRPHHISILEENGFKLEGRLKQHVFIEKRFIDSLIHGCLKEEGYFV